MSGLPSVSLSSELCSRNTLGIQAGLILSVCACASACVSHPGRNGYAARLVCISTLSPRATKCWLCNLFSRIDYILNHQSKSELCQRL